MIRKVKSRCEHLFKYVFADEFPSWKFPINRYYNANEFVTKNKWEEQLGTVVNVYCKTCSPPNFLRDSQSTDVAKDNDIRRVVVTLKSQKSAKRQIHSEALHVCVHLRDLLVPHNVFGSLLANCRSHMLSTVQDIWAWITRARSREHAPTTYSRWFLWIYSHHYPINIITLSNIGWLRISEKIRRRRCLAIDVHDCS